MLDRDTSGARSHHDLNGLLGDHGLYFSLGYMARGIAWQLYVASMLLAGVKQREASRMALS